MEFSMCWLVPVCCTCAARLLLRFSGTTWHCLNPPCMQTHLEQASSMGNKGVTAITVWWLDFWKTRWPIRLSGDFCPFYSSVPGSVASFPCAWTAKLEWSWGGLWNAASLPLPPATKRWEFCSPLMKLHLVKVNNISFSLKWSGI